MLRKNAKKRIDSVKSRHQALSRLQTAKYIAQLVSWRDPWLCFHYRREIRRIIPKPSHSSPGHVFSINHDHLLFRENKHKVPCQHSNIVASHSNVATGRKFRHSIRRFEQDLINSLPDHLLLQIFSFLPHARDRAACASVSMRWLMLQGHMLRDDFRFLENQAAGAKGSSVQKEGTCKDSYQGMELDIPLSTSRDVSRCLDGKKATDVRLAAAAVMAGVRGGLERLTIREGSGVTDMGLSAIGFCCLTLKELFLWNCIAIQDEALHAIGNNCHLLQKLDLIKCPAVGNRGLQSIGRNCKLLSSLSLDGCTMIGDDAFSSVGEGCPELVQLTVRNCPLVGDNGLKSIFAKCKGLKKVRLEGLRAGDQTLVSILVYCKALLSLSLHNMDAVTAEGFTSFTKTSEMPLLKELSISSCKGFSDEALSAIPLSCPNVKHVLLVKCDSVSDQGIAAFTYLAYSLEAVHVEKCPRITEKGLLAVLTNTTNKAAEVKFKHCDGVGDRHVDLFAPFCTTRNSTLKAICLANCSGVGNRFLSLLGLLCPRVLSLDLSGLTGMSDEGLWGFFCNGRNELTSMKLSSCAKITDVVVCAIVQQCGGSLKELVLDSCKMVTDKSMKAIAMQCDVLEDLDVSQCAITDDGIMALTYGVGKTLRSLNLSGCTQITDKALKHIEQNCEDILGLNVKHCGELSATTLNTFVSQMWRCDVLRS